MVSGFNFTERMRVVLAMAREEAARLHHEYVGTEHLLLGLVREGEGVAATVLQNLNVERDDIQQKVEQIVNRGRAAQTPGPDLPYTSRAKQVLELAMREARELGHRFVGTEHLLLGLLREEKGIGAQVLAAAGVTLEAARAETLRILGTDLPPQWLGPHPPTTSESATQYENLGAVRNQPLERVQVVLHYRDGQRFEASFATAQDAQGFLAWAAPRSR